MIAKQLATWARAWENVTLLAVMGGWLFSGGAASAQTWSGQANTSWNNPTNWSASWQVAQGLIQSVPSAGANVTIPSGCPAYPVVTSSLNLGSVTMNSGGGSLTLNGGTLTVGSITLGDGAQVTVASGASINASGAITAYGTWTNNGSITAASMTMDGGSAITINSNASVNVASGGINVNSGGGSLNIYGTLNDGANTFNDSCSVLLAGGSLTCGSFALNGNSFTMYGGCFTNSSLTVNTGNFIAASNAVLNAGTGAITESGSSLTLGDVTVTGGAFSVSGGNCTVSPVHTASINVGTGAIGVSGGSLTLTNTTLTGGAITVGNGSFTVNSNSVINSTGGGACSFSGGSFLANAGTRLNISGGLTSYNSCFGTAAGSTVSITGPITSYSSCNINGGNFTLGGGTEMVPAGTFTSLALNAGGTYSLLSGTTINGNLSVAASTIMNLAAGVNITAGSLTLGGAGQASGTWGYSGETHNNTTYFANTTGYLTVATNTAVTATTTTLGPIPAATYGNNVTFTATILPVAATGTVQFQTNGVAYGSPVTVSAGKAAYTISTLAAGSYTITAVYGGNATYNGSTSGTSSLVVSPAGVTITSGVTAGNKTYDGTTTATLSANNVVLAGVLPADAANVNLSLNTYTATFARATVGSGIAVTVSGLTLTGSAAANYSLTQPSGLTGSIAAAPVTIASGITANGKDYNGTTTGTIISNNVVLSGVVAADTANVKVSTNGYTSTFASASAGSGIAVTIGGLTLTGTAAANYALTQPTGLTATINPAHITISSGITANNKAYDGTTTATISSNSVVLTGVVAGDAANVKISTNGYVATFASATAGSGIGVTVSGLTLTGSAAGNYKLNQPAGLTASITATTVTITSGLTANTKAFDGTTTATISSNNVVLSGVAAGDAANVKLSTNGYTATFASAGVTNSAGVTVSGLTLTGSAAGNYTLTQPAGLTAGITAIPVTVTSGVTVNSKVYDGTTMATISSNNVVLGGVVAGDVANVKLSTNGYAATFASATAGSGIGVTISGLTLRGSAAGNYILTQPASLTGGITAALVTITSGITVNSKAYDSTTTATISSNNVVLSGVVAGDVANVKLSTNGYTATFASASSGSGIAVTVADLSLTGSAAANYALTQPAGLTAGISAIPVTIASGITANDKVYNGTTTAAISSNNVVLSGVVAGDNVALSTNGYAAAFASATAGSEINVTVSGLTLTGSAAGNYTLAQPVGLTAEISAAPVTITSGIMALSKAYDGTTTAAISSNNVVLSGVIAADTAHVRLSTNGYTAKFTSATGGSGIAVTVSGLTLTGTASGNYALTQPSGLTAGISTVAVTISSGLTVNSKAYDRTTAATISSNNVVLSGVLAGDNVALSTNGYTATFASASVSNHVSVTVSGLTLTGSDAANYTLTQPAGLTAGISAISVSITSGITANSRIFNGTNTATISSNNVVLNGVLAGDTASVKLSTNGYTATFASPLAGSGIAVTVSGLSLTGSAAGNYTLIQPQGLSANIGAATVAVASGITADSKPYDGTTTATISSNNVVLTGVAAGDAANVSLATDNYSAAFATAAAGTGIHVTVSGLALTGSAAANYTLIQPTNLTAAITAIPVTVASGVTANEKVYNGTTAATISVNNVVLSGVLPGDNVALATRGSTAAFASAAAGGGIPVTVNGLTLSGSDAGNYILTQPVGLTADITPAPVAIASGITAASKVYDGTTTATLNFGTVALSGVVAGDAANVKLSTAGYTANFASATVGTGISVTVSGLALTGSAAGNYALVQPASLTAAITTAPVTVASGVFANNKAYDGTTKAAISLNNVVLNGVLNGDDVALATNGYTATFASAAAANAVAVTVSGLTLTGADAANYQLTQPTGLKANITTMTVTFTSPTSGQQIISNSPTVSVAGITSGNSVITGVWLSLDGVTWTNATTANNWTNWTGALPVTAGAQTLRTFAVDIAGNYSPTNTVSFAIIHTDTLTVQTNGFGTVTPNYNGQTLNIGQAYTMVAAGKNGWTFSRWSSNQQPDSNAASLTFTMASNLVLTANFENTTRPTVAVTAPVSGQQFVTNGQTVTVTGTATGNVAGNVTVASVWLSLDGVTWTNPVTANNWTNWNAVLPVSAGAQTLRAFAIDATGNYSLTNLVPFTIIHTGTLLVTTNGAGSVSPNYNGQTLEIGQNYAMTATAAANWKFTDWTSNLLPTTNTAALKFNMASNLVLTANFAYTIPPVLTVIALTNKQVIVTNVTTTTVKGTASSKVPLAAVSVNINGSAWSTAVTTNNWTNWSIVLPISSGAQVMQAYATDIYGNNSLTNTIAFQIAHTGLMTVHTNGNGTVSPNYDNTQIQIGGVYSMLATGRHGYTFTNWTSNQLPGQILTQNATVTFQMVSNLVLTATYVDISQPTLNMPVLSPGVYAETNISPLVINGTTVSAADDSLVTNVVLSFNSNDWQSASTGNNWTNWTTSFVPQPGTNYIVAFAADAAGNHSVTNTFKFTYFEALPLTVQTNQSGTTGLGTITLSTNGSSLIVGTKYFIKATPLTGSVFSNWTSNLLPTTNTATLEFTMVSNLVLFANFLDNTKPTLLVTNLVNGQSVGGSPLTISGTATDNVAVASVWLSINSNAWQQANGTTRWSTTAALVPGTNNIRTYCLDTGNNISLTNVLNVKYAVPVALTLITNGLGTITGAGGSFYVGQTYTLTAVPATGFLFTNWTGNLVPGTTKATIQFTMVTNLTLTANFVDTAIPTVTITSPATTRPTNSLFTLTGTASDNWGLGGVYCQLNGGGWTLAGTTLAGTASAYTTWYQSFTLVPGTNIIRAYSVDLGGGYQYGVVRHSTTNSITIYFQTAPFNLSSLRAVVTPDDGSPAFELNFGPTTYSQYAWDTNGDNGAGTYTYSNPSLTNGVLTLQPAAFADNVYAQTVPLNFTDRYSARLTYVNDHHQSVSASAVFSAISNVAPTTVSGQTLVSVTGTGTIVTNNYLTNGMVVQIYGSTRQTNAWTYQTYGLFGGLLTISGGGLTNWTLVHYEAVHAGEYVTANREDVTDMGLMGFVRSTTGGNAPPLGTLNGHMLAANSGPTLSSLALTTSGFTLTTSDDSFSGLGTYIYSQVNQNTGQFILDYTSPENTPASTEVIQFANPNFGIFTNATGISGLILR